MGRIKRFIADNIIVALAVIFVGYHITSTIFGFVSFSKLIFGTNEEVVVESSQENIQSVASANDQITDLVYGYEVNASQWPTRIIMTPVHINIPINSQPRQQEQWQTSTTIATFDTNSALPNGKAGNTIIFGQSEAGPFQTLEQLKIYDEILIETPTADYVYTVTGFTKINHEDMANFTQSPDPILTLITAPQWSSDQKTVVTADYERMIKKN